MYSDPNYAVRREYCSPPTTAGATTEGAKFRSFQKMKLKKVHAAVIVCGSLLFSKIQIIFFSRALSASIRNCN